MTESSCLIECSPCFAVSSILTVSSILNEFPVEQEEIIQMSVSRAKKAGRYHLMQAENPVFILSFYFAGGTES